MANKLSGTVQSAEKAPKTTLLKESYRNLPLVRLNFILLAISGALIVIGFLLMLGAGSTIEQFNPDIFSPRRMVVAPTICFLGYVGVIVAIIIKPKEKTESN